MLEQRWGREPGPERTAMRWVPGASVHWEESSPRAQAQQAGKPPDAKPAVLGPPRDLPQAGKGHSHSG